MDYFTLDEGTKETILKMAGLAAAIGPVLIVVGKLSQNLSSIIGLFSKLSGTAAAAETATTAMSGSLGAAGAAAKASSLLLNPWTAALVGGGLAAIEVAKYLKEETIPAVELFDETISETTQEAITNFLELEKQAKTSFYQLSWSGATVTEKWKLQ